MMGNYVGAVPVHAHANAEQMQKQTEQMLGAFGSSADRATRTIFAPASSAFWPGVWVPMGARLAELGQ